MVAAYFPRNFGEFVISGFCREAQKYFLTVEDGAGTKSVVFWVITRHRVVIIYRRFGTTYRSLPDDSRFKVGKKACNIGTAKNSGVARRVM